jgi:hypothetical protein
LLLAENRGLSPITEKTVVCPLLLCGLSPITSTLI